MTVSNFVNTVKTRIKDDTFCPVKYTDKRGYRFFSLLPVYLFQGKSVQIDAHAFWRLLFGFSKIGFRARKSLSNGRKTLRALYILMAIQYHFCSHESQRKATLMPLPKKKPPDFRNEIENGCQVWALDPGITAVLQCNESVFKVIWNCDVMAAKNNGARLSPFLRPLL
ncbi:hypothetical protein J3Q64DRAFT_1697197 [Phycomyces blakesleeanus]